MDREYIYHSFTRALCSKCGKLIDAKIVYNDKVYILKNCPTCGEHKELLEELPSWHLKKAEYNKPATISPTQTEVKKGCPFDCGLCPAHDQHTCIGLIEINKRCNWNCPHCYANAENSKDLSLEQIEKMMDFYQETESHSAEILQISGGEPTLHPDIFKIIEMAKEKKFKYVMLNTNGSLIDDEFASKLEQYRGGFEVYLHFDDVNNKVSLKAVKNLDKHKIPTTLVATISKDNENKVGEILSFAMKTTSIRGVNFQPMAYYSEEKPNLDRITLSGVLNRIEEQTKGLLKVDDFIPLPCNTERNALTFLLKDKKGNLCPITRDRDLREFKNLIGSTFMFRVEDVLTNFKEGAEIFNIGCSCCDLMVDIKKYLPLNFLIKSKEEKMQFVDENTFRISVSSFVDKYNFDTKGMQKECVHIITPDLKKIPFSAYNMLHRKARDEYYQ